MKKILLVFFAFVFANLHAQDANLLQAKLSKQVIIDSILVQKEKRLMTVFSKGKAEKIYKIALGKNPVGAKHFKDDHKTPEGLYFIDGKNAASNFHKSLGVSYPNAADKAYAKSQGEEPGKDIKIHGFPNQVPKGAKMMGDWTDGCVGITNEEIDELFPLVKITTPVLFVP